MRTAYDLAPLYRSVIGVDRVADLVESAMRRANEGVGAPPYDIEMTGEHAYRISLAAAGYGPSDLTVTAQPNLLIVSGRRARGEGGERRFLHRGIAGQAFEHRFELADDVVVKSAAYADGLLTVELERQAPEAARPRRIDIRAGGPSGLQRLLKDRRKARKAA